jgi:hypothetical protein
VEVSYLEVVLPYLVVPSYLEEAFSFLEVASYQEEEGVAFLEAGFLGRA